MVFSVDFFKILLFCFVIFFGGIPLFGVNVTVNYVLIIVIFSSVFISIIKRKPYIRIPIPILIINLIFFLLLGASYCNYYFFDVGDDAFILFETNQIFLVFINTVGFYILLDKSNIKISRLNLARAVLLFIFISFMLYLFQMCSESFRIYYINNLTVLNGYWLDVALYYFRGVGWQGLSIWDTSISFSFLFVLIFPMLESNKRLDNFFWIIGCCLTLAITGVSGRTGLIILFFYIFFQLFYSRKVNVVIQLVMLFFIFILTVSILAPSKFYELLYFSLELFINLIDGKGFNSASTDDLLQNHLYIPHIENIIFGDNYNINDSILKDGNKKSDSSFVINYVSYGLMGLVSVLIICIFNFSVLQKTLVFSGVKNKITPCVLLFFLVFFMYLKVPVYVSQTVLKVMMLLYFMSRSTVGANVKGNQNSGH